MFSAWNLCGNRYVCPTSCEHVVVTTCGYSQTGRRAGRPAVDSICEYIREKPHCTLLSVISIVCSAVKSTQQWEWLVNLVECRLARSNSSFKSTTVGVKNFKFVASEAWLFHSALSVYLCLLQCTSRAIAHSLLSQKIFRFQFFFPYFWCLLKAMPRRSASATRNILVMSTRAQKRIRQRDQEKINFRMAAKKASCIVEAGTKGG